MVYGKQDRLSAKRCWNVFYPDSRLDEVNVPVTSFYDHYMQQMIIILLSFQPKFSESTI